MPKIQEIPSTCPECQQRGFWDNRDDKKNPKAPDFKCKNKACGHGIWLAKGSVWVDRPGPNQQQSAPQPYREVGDLPGYPANAQEADEQRFVEQVKQQDQRGAQAFADLCRLHAACLQHVLTHEAQQMDETEVALTDAGIFAAAATLFIEANKRGIVLPPAEQARRVA